MREVKRKFDADVFSPERLERIEALRNVIGKYRVLFKGDDGGSDYGCTEGTCGADPDPE